MIGGGFVSYWQDRAAKAQAALTEKNGNEIRKKLTKYYGDSMKRVIRNFESTYIKVLEAVEDGKKPTPADLYKLDSYWQMQGQLRDELQKLGDKTIYLLSHEFEKDYFDIYNSIAIPSQEAFSTISRENVAQMINSIWCADGQSWSNRVWKNTELLAETLNDELIHCVTTGAKTSRLKEVLQDRFSVSYSNADMIARTELAHIQTESAKRRYEDYGITEVMVWADEDERRCEICGELHETKYPIGAQMPVPAHPRCRCCIIPVVE